MNNRFGAGEARGEHDQLLALAGLDVEFLGAEGDYLHWQDHLGNHRRALDLSGGSASVLGHNHPEMVRAALRHFHDRRPVYAPSARTRGSAALKHALADRLSRETGRSYDVLLFTSATASLQAAVARARLELRRRQRDARARLTARLRELQNRSMREAWAPGVAFFRQWERALGVGPLHDFPSLERAFLDKNAAALEHAGHVLAIPDGFRSSKELQLATEQTTVMFYEPELGPLFVRRTSFSTLAAVLVEPVWDEDTLEIEEELVQWLQVLRDAHPEIPFVVDESECGLGRTGRFLEGVARGIPVDYLVLGRSLGGGVATIAALAVDRERDLQDGSPAQGLLPIHDDFSPAMGAACLATIDRDRVLERCEQTGHALRDGLVKVARCWPGQIAGVRGRGMMLAIEFQKQIDNPSDVVRALDQEELLGAAIAGFLLRRREIRVLPGGTHGRVLQIQPSAYLSTSEIERVALAFGEVAALLAAGDAFSLLAHLAHREAGEKPAESVTQDSQRGAKPYSGRRSSVELIGRLVENEPVVTWDPSRGRFRSEELATLLDRLSELVSLDPLEAPASRSRRAAETETSSLAADSRRRDTGL